MHLINVESSEKAMTQKVVNRNKVFISYCHTDLQYLKRLQTHFAHYERLGIVEVWDDTKINPGARWQEEIKEAISQARIAVLLVSADFLASTFIAENELPPLLAAAKTEGATIIPVILSACAFEASELAQFQAINNPSRPVGSMSRDEKEKIWAEVAKIVSDAIHGKQPVNVSQEKLAAFTLEKDFALETAYAKQLILERPRGWEYLLIAELLQSKLQPIKHRLSDLQRGLVYKKTKILKGQKFLDWTHSKANDLLSLIGLAAKTVNEELSVACGAPGVAGDPLEIKLVVEKLIFVCEEMVNWETEVRFVAVPKQLERLKQAMEGWTFDFIRQIDTLPDKLTALPFNQPNATGTYSVNIVFQEPPQVKVFNRELKALKFKTMIFGKKSLSS
jgi:hypothetical protein